MLFSLAEFGEKTGQNATTGANGAKQQQQDNNGPEQKRTCVKKFKQQIQMFKCLKFKLQ